MKILILTPWFPRSPQDQHGNFILDSVEALIELGHEVVVLVTTAWKPFAFLNYKNKARTKFNHHFDLYYCHYFSIPRHYCSPVSFWNYKIIVGTALKKIIEKHDIQV